MKLPTFLKSSLILAFFAVFWSAVHAQEVVAPTTTVAPVSTPEPATNFVSFTKITDQSLHTQRLIDQFTVLLQPSEQVQALKNSFPDVETQTRKSQAETIQLIDQQSTTVDQIRNNQTEWGFKRNDLNTQFQTLRSRASVLEDAIAQLAQEEAEWDKLNVLLDNTSPPEAKKIIQKAILDIAAARKFITTPLKDILTFANQWLDLIDVADEMQQLLKQHEFRARKDFFSKTEPYLWQVQSNDIRINEDADIAIKQQIKFTVHYLKVHPINNAIVLSSVVILLILVWRLQIRSRNSTVADPGKSLRFALLSRPCSTVIAASATLALMLYQYTPALFEIFLTLILLVPVARIGLPLITKSLHSLVWGISLLYMTNSVSALIESIPSMHRLWIIFCSALTVIVFVHALQRLAKGTSSTSFFWKTLQPTGWLCIATSLFACISAVLGFMTLANVLIIGLVNSAYVALCLTVATGIISDLVIATLYLPLLSASYLVRRNRHLLSHQCRKAGTWIGVLAWIHYVLNQFYLDELFFEFIKSQLNNGFTMGNVSITLGSLFTVGITIWLSLKLSQLIRFILIEDIAPRAGMARGVPEAVGSLLHYTIILIGFFLAISAAGIDLSKLTIIIGALGVGIGIGLQDVVNNFTSGLILLFEQNIKQGDIVQCSTVNGRVLDIGLRSSIIRTFDGAEVILPNSELVSAQVINWTHSDQERRITVPIGASYDVDPQIVIDALLTVANSDPDILPEPAAKAFLFRFGASNMEFELRCWVANGEMLNEVTSRLCVSIAHEFKHQGISIPCPQRDIYIKNFDNNTRPANPPAMPSV
jgi:small-conductance mechanosensitive channel